MKRWFLFLFFLCPLIACAQEQQSPKPGISIYGSPCLIGNLTLSCMPKTCDSITIIAGDSIDFCTFQQIFLNTDTAYWLRWQFTGATNLPDTILNAYPSATPICYSPRWDTAGTFIVEVFYNGWLNAYPGSDCYQFGPSHWYVQVNVLPDPNAISENESPSITVIPNPSNGIFSIDIDPGFELQKVIITNMHGQIVCTSENYQVDLSLQPAGFYFLLVETNKGILAEQIVRQ